jgi:hypothetical protein
MEKKEIWEMTYEQYCTNYIENSKYSKAIKSNETQLKATRNICLTNWTKALEERAEIGSIPEIVIRAYVKMFGEEQTKRVFRGTKEQGLKEWRQTQINKLDRLTRKEQFEICK